MEIREITLSLFVSSLVVIGKPYEYCNVLLFYIVLILCILTLCMYSRLSLSRTRDSMKHFEISVLRHIRFAEMRKTINRTATFNRMNYVI